MQIKQFSNIEEYVKYVLQIFVHIFVCNHLSTLYMHSFLSVKFDLNSIENNFVITSLYLHEMLNSVISL
jgi:hypothetical protein